MKYCYRCKSKIVWTLIPTSYASDTGELICKAHRRCPQAHPSGLINFFLAFFNRDHANEIVTDFMMDRANAGEGGKRF